MNFPDCGLVDGELSAKIESERQLELDANSPSEDLPPHLKEYLDSSSWQVGTINTYFHTQAHKL